MQWWLLSMVLAAMTWLCDGMCTLLAMTWPVVLVLGLGGSVDMMGVPVDIPVSLSGRSGSSWSAVCITVSMVQVGVIWVQESIGMLAVDPICMPSSTWIHVCGSTHLPWPCFISHASHSAVFPRSSPSFSPFSYSSSSIAVFPFFSALEIPSFNTKYACSRPCAMIASYSSGWCCCTQRACMATSSFVRACPLLSDVVGFALKSGGCECW
jgi:hypothetical protein